MAEPPELQPLLRAGQFAYSRGKHRACLHSIFPTRASRDLQEAGPEQETGANSWGWVFLSWFVRPLSSATDCTDSFIASLNAQGLNAQGPFTVQAYGGLLLAGY